jgi:hypothetical protein
LYPWLSHLRVSLHWKVVLINIDNMLTPSTLLATIFEITFIIVKGSYIVIIKCNHALCVAFIIMLPLVDSFLVFIHYTFIVQFVIIWILLLLLIIFSIHWKIMFDVWLKSTICFKIILCIKQIDNITTLFTSQNFHMNMFWWKHHVVVFWECCTQSQNLMQITKQQTSRSFFYTS